MRTQILASLGLLVGFAGCGGASAPSASAPQMAPSSLSAQPSTSATIKIGWIGTLTGGASPSGIDNRDGFLLFFNSLNNTVAGRKIEIAAADDQGQADVGATKAQQLVENEKVQVLAGGGLTPVCYAEAAYVQKAQVPFVIVSQCAAENMLVDPKFKSPYLVRTTISATSQNTTVGDYAAKNGWHTVAIMASDYGGGREVTDSVASSFVKKGGSVIQELYPPLGTNDFGPYLAQVKQDADFIWTFFPGTDGLRFGEQYGSYLTAKKPILDTATILVGSNVDQLKDKALPMTGFAIYSRAIDSDLNRAFLKLANGKYPGRAISNDFAMGYTGAQALAGALQKVNGAVEDKQQFLNALYATNLDTARGPLKLDQDHDVIENVYYYKIVKHNEAYSQELLTTYTDRSRGTERTPEELANFPFGRMKGKWVGMTADKLRDYWKPAAS